ncbi:MAG: hypothetical protein E7563_03740 [Ruminococcaceae bacterium]|nr:hypothetical protein [Oscillospiraceae bacterium]
MKRFSMRVLACLIVAIMVISIVPVSVFASDDIAVVNANTGVTDNYSEVVGLNVITDDQSTLAPGVTLNEIVAFDKNNKRVEMYVTTVDTSVDTVQVYANYMDNQISTWGLQTLSEQVAAMEKNYEEPFTVVAGINASYYNTTTGKPTGAFVMEGVDVTNEAEGNNYAFFAVLKDGTYMIGNKGDYSTYKGQIKEAIGGYQHIVKDGAVVSGLDKTTKYPRQTIGLTKDGKIYLMTADGSQTQTVGLTIQEQAEVMLAMGCEDALHLDGGNSATFGGIREGTKEFVLLNSPSGLAERAVSNTLCIVSTAVADGTFSRAAISGEYDFFVPNSTYTFTAKGIDAAGGPAEIPADVEWALSDSSFGTITDGTFVSNGKIGDVSIQMVQGGKVVGSNDIHVVVPTSITFDAEDKTIPYSKSASIAVTAMYNLNEIYSVASDYTFVIANEKAGTIDGFTFNATTDESVKSTTVTATYKYADGLTDVVNINFGKGSDVLFDFEDGDVSDWHGIDTIFDWINDKNAANPDAKYPVSEPLNGYSNGIEKQTSSVFLASSENGGKVKNGKYSLGFTMDHKNVTDIGGWLYNYLYYTGETKVLRDVENGMNGIRIGMWVYSPGVTNTAFRITRGTTTTAGVTGIKYSYMKSAYDGKNVSYSTNYGVPETGWIYIYYDLTDVADNIKQTTSLYDPENNNGVKFGTSGGNYYPAFLQLFTGSATDTPQTVTYFIDDITIDYSDVTDDRNAPSITDTKVSANVDNFVPINGQTVNNNCLSFEATIAEVQNSNATGLDYSTAKIYVDGIDVSDYSTFKCAGTTIALSDVYLNNGKHDIAFEIADKQGNVTRVTNTLTVAGETDTPIVSIVGRNESGATPKAGSVYYADINTTDAAKTKSVKTTLKLDLSNAFEYKNIVLAPGVEAEYEYDELDRELTLTLTNNGTLTGEQTLASVPVRVWSWDEATTGVTADKQFASGAIPTINIELKSIYGSVSFVDGTVDNNYICGVSGAFNVATELDNKTAWHKHTEAAVADKAATCTEDGFTGRTYCDGCKSVINWGETVEATGHTYSFADGVLKCACGELFNGEYTDGKTYVDGVAVGGWVNDSYYVDGVKYTGIREVNGYFYNFGTDGVCTGKTKYTGLVTDENGTRYAIAGSIVTGWQLVDDDWYYFDSTTYGVSGQQKIGVITYEFEEDGKLTSGVWAKTLYGTRYYYGPDYYNKSFQTIDGKEYYFENGYRLEDGWQLTVNISNEHKWYYFDENGVYDRNAVIEDGFYTDRNGYAYAKNGEGLRGLQLIDGVYYFFDFKGYAMTGMHADRLFGEDFKAVTGIMQTANGPVYYKDGRPNMAGLIMIDGDYYFAGGAKGELTVNEVKYVWKANGYLPEAEYEFGPDGKMLQGIVEKDGKLYYYKNGKGTMAGLINIDGDYYFAGGAKGELTVNEYKYVWKTNGYLPEREYHFGPDGKMLNGIAPNADGKLCYYENGVAKMAGLVNIDGDYYFAGGTKGEITVNEYKYVWKDNGLLPAREYHFGPDGKMLDGIHMRDDGVLCYYETGVAKMAGLINIDGDYYFAGGAKGELTVNEYKYVWKDNGLLPAREYHFGPDGKMLDGIHMRDDGILCYYETGVAKMAGLINIDGDYYFAGGPKGELTVNEYKYVWKDNGLLPAREYQFGPDGKMLQGIVEGEDGKLYFYKNGVAKMYGLVEWNGDLYFVDGSKGEVVVDQKKYVWKGNGILPEAEYEFGADGKMLDGFVTKADGLYYYENGKPGRVGLNYIDGYYYFVDYSGKLTVNKTQYVWATNGLTIEMNYRFDELGRAVL